MQLAMPPGFMTFSPKFLPGFRHLFAYVDEAAHFITDDAPAAVADLSLD
jgi:hypothetical protein